MVTIMRKFDFLFDLLFILILLKELCILKFNSVCVLENILAIISFCGDRCFRFYSVISLSLS
jgi:hypothetical protein